MKTTLSASDLPALLVAAGLDPHSPAWLRIALGLSALVSVEVGALPPLRDDWHAEVCAWDVLNRPALRRVSPPRLDLASGLSTLRATIVAAQVRARLAADRTARRNVAT